MSVAGGRPLAAALLIDDDIALLESWRRRAQVEGFEIDLAATWDEGLSLFQTLSPDLVVADYNLPGSAHGLRLLVEIRALRPSTRLILISGLVEPDVLSQAEELGVVDRVLSKGDSARSLEVVMEELRVSTASSGQPTDWAAFAKAQQSASSIDTAAVGELDRLLSRSAERG